MKTGYDADYEADDAGYYDYPIFRVIVTVLCIVFLAAAGMSVLFLLQFQ